MKGSRLIKSQGVKLNSLKDGQVAIILDWSGNPNFNGQVVQRFKDVFIEIGKCSGHSFKETNNNFDKVLVRILSNGDMLEIL